MNFSVIIPTYNRPKDLNVCLESILNQSVLPDEVLVIDDGDLESEYINKVEEKFDNKNIKLVYHKKNHEVHPRGSSESRNVGVDLVSNDIFFILDDDLILDNDFFEKVMNVWGGNVDENLIGVGGVIKNNRGKLWVEELYNKVFGLSSKKSWDVNRVAFQSWDDRIEDQKKGYYVHGGVCSYNRSLIKELGGFSTFSGGRTALEDVDLCLRAKNKGYHFLIEPKAKVIHNHSSESREDSFMIGYKEMVNRKVIFLNNSKQSIKNKIWFEWACSGWVLRQIVVGNFRKAFGMIRGIFTLL